MITVREFLAWYNNLDVAPFLAAVEKMSAFWQEQNKDMFKDGISVPGLTLKYTSSRSWTNKCSSACSTNPIAISITSLKITKRAGQVSSFTATMRPAKPN